MFANLVVDCPRLHASAGGSTDSLQRRAVPCCRWGKSVIVFGEEGLRKDHPVVKFLAEENKCKSLSIYRPGCGCETGSGGDSVHQFA